MEKPERNWDLWVKIDCLELKKQGVVEELKKANLLPAFCMKLGDTIYASLFFSFPDLSTADIYRKVRIIKGRLYGKVVEFRVRP